ncbi:ATP-binding cassette domain-containing protein [Streptacidiphilus sp. PB12-B1b]|uniref:ATP-binding cassette domain-containing protein n=1 Tax=Streptacidiphilus sp. PB12-B1b TaxID=2705012 RepID=UPI0015FBD7AF|nr:ATP-binding cassette domain-containing protein [Streptacidiphilus sp. PB12-B1b]QMU76724.1 ATP-binding cassette domain-containing protein [Streptacidiphilus sp. PB12-B1b]
MDGVEIAARGLSVRGARGPVFENVDVQVPPGGLLVVHGTARSGRTSLLLALSGRMRLNAGTVRIGPYTVPSQARKAAALVTVARAEPAVALEERLRVGELMSERCWTSRAVTRQGIRDAASAVGLELDERLLVEELTALDQTRLALALALAGRPAALVIDDVDAGCTDEQRRQAWQAVALAHEQGCTVLAGALQEPPPQGEPVELVSLPQLSAHRLPPAVTTDAHRLPPVVTAEPRKAIAE